MARAQRIEYEGALYHVTARGNERRASFWTMPTGSDSFVCWRRASSARATDHHRRRIENHLPLIVNLRADPRLSTVYLGTQMRCPDGLQQGVISEVKNVAYQGWTQQLVDYSVYALVNGMRFDLYVRQSTALSPLLQAAARTGLVNIITVPGMGE
jgi:hypothetical protein